MKLTIDFLKVNHKKYNELYFNNSLTMPNFLIKKTCKKTLGYYMKSKNIIMISTFYERTERDIIRTLIHEMIHQFIDEQNIKDTSTHGYVFKGIANRINVDGWNITVKEKLPQDIQTSKKHLYHIIRFKEDNGKYFIFVTASNCYDYFYYGLKQRYSNVERYKSHNPIFVNFKQCRSRIMGLRVSEHELVKYA